MLEILLWQWRGGGEVEERKGWKGKRSRFMPCHEAAFTFTFTLGPRLEAPLFQRREALAVDMKRYADVRRCPRAFLPDHNYPSFICRSFYNYSGMEKLLICPLERVTRSSVIERRSKRPSLNLRCT